MIRIYIAGAFTEQFERAKPMMNRARELGMHITHDWTVSGDHLPEGLDAELTHVQRRQYSEEDLKGVRTADILWLLAPNTSGSRGAWVELGYALALREMYWSDSGVHTKIIVSGPMHRRSIFTELADRLFDTDHEALRWLSDLAEEDKETGT